MQYLYFIGEGEEAKALAQDVKARAEAWNETRRVLRGKVEALGFGGNWLCGGSFMGTPTIGGVWVCRKLTREEESQLGVKYESQMEDGQAYAYTPRMNTKSGRALKAMIDEANHGAFGHNDYVLGILGMKSMSFEGRRLHCSAAGICGDKVVVMVPVSGEKEMPTPPAWLREVQESEFLAAQGR